MKAISAVCLATFLAIIVIGSVCLAVSERRDKNKLEVYYQARLQQQSDIMDSMNGRLTQMTNNVREMQTELTQAKWQDEKMMEDGRQAEALAADNAHLKLENTSLHAEILRYQSIYSNGRSTGPNIGQRINAQ